MTAGLLARVPRCIWLALAVAGLIGAGVWWHGRQVKAFGNERYAAGKAARDAQITALQDKLDAANARIAAELRRNNDEEARRINRAADDLRLRGPGRAGASCPASPSSGHEPTRGGAHVAGPQLPPDDRAAVPWGWLVQRAEQADLNRAEVIAWREWHRQMTDEWNKWREEARPQ